MLDGRQRQPGHQQVPVGGTARVGTRQGPEVVTDQGRSEGPEPARSQGLSDHGWLVAAAAAGQLPVDLLDGQQVDPQGPDPGHDRIQVDLVGLFPAGAGDVPGRDAKAWHRRSMAEPLPPGQSPGFRR
jgi:hypothetical protein